MLGGVAAVTWTDVKQMVIILAGLTGCVVVILAGLPEGVSLADGLRLAGSTGMLETMDFSFDLEERYTIWSGLFAALFLFLSYRGRGGKHARPDEQGSNPDWPEDGDTHDELLSP